MPGLAYAARNNIYIVACYADRHMTGRTDRRPEFHRMLRDAEAGSWSFVLTWKNDRFARNRYDAAIYKAKLKKCGVRCLFSQEYIPAGPEGILLEAMLEGDAEFRSAQMAVDIKRGLAYNAEHCMVTGAIPFGYRRTKDYTLELDPDRAPLVKEIYDRFLSGWKIIDIANDLNRRGITTASGKPWGRNSFHRMLSNERYTGVYIYGDICFGRCSFLAPALEVFTESPLGELCAVPLALVPVQRAGRTTLELLVDRGVVDGETCRDVSRPVSDQVPRLDLLPVLEGQVAVLSRRSHLRLIWSIKKKKCTADSVGVSVHLILADTQDGKQG